MYSGALCRLFTNDWENIIQQIAREHGMTYNVRYPDGEPNWPTIEQARDFIGWMQAALTDSLALESRSPQWNELLSDYFTDKLHEEGREALMLVAAYLRRPDLQRPTSMPLAEGDDEALNEAGPGGYLVSTIAPLEAALVVPGETDKLTFIEDPLKVKRLTCTTGFLRKVMAELAEGVWHGNVDPTGWRERGLAYARSAGSQDATTGEWTGEPEPPDSLMRNAEYAFGIYHAALEFSEKHDAPIASW
jgi:hypothetical protein